MREKDGFGPGFRALIGQKPGPYHERVPLFFEELKLPYEVRSRGGRRKKEPQPLAAEEAEKLGADLEAALGYDDEQNTEKP